MALSADTKVKIKVIDVETTSHAGDPDWTHPANKSVLWGCLDPDQVAAVWTSSNTHEMRSVLWGSELDKDHLLLVGHHLMFDIGYAHKDYIITPSELATNCSIWDTMVAEYVLSGQQTKFIKLEALATRYGIEFKKNPDVIAHFESGKGADTIPIATLTAYLAEDLYITFEIFKRQFDEAQRRGMLPLMWAMMDFRSATINMRWNGIAIDPAALAETQRQCVLEVSRTNLAADKLVQSLTVALKVDATLSAVKPPQLTNLLFGGMRIITTMVEVGKYKNGKAKFKNKATPCPYKGVLELLGIAHKLERSSDEDTLERVQELLRLHGMGTPTPGGQLAALIEQVLRFRKAQKILKTYVEPTQLSCMKFSNRIYPTINTTATNTGRTSCADPNLQNVPKNSLGDYRKCITTTTPTESQLCELDYAQLEVVALALLSGDEQLTADIGGGVDIHTKLFEEVHGRSPSTEERRQFKRAVFCLIYGGGVGAIAQQGNTTHTKAKLLQERWATRYPKTMEFRARVLKDVKDNSEVSTERKFPIPHRVGYWDSPTGRCYHFSQRLIDKGYQITKSSSSGPYCDWSPQETANYPIQGLATADMVPLMIGMLYRFIYSKEWAAHWELNHVDVIIPKMLMAVHDSVLFEVEIHNEKLTMMLLKSFLETLPLQMKKVFGMDCGSLPFKVDVSVGRNWQDMVDVV